MQYYFTIAGFVLDANTATVAVGAIMSEADIVELGNETAARLGTSLPEQEGYDGEQFDASVELLNDGPAFFYIYDCDSQADVFLAHSGEFGSGILREARNLAHAWHARSAPRH